MATVWTVNCEVVMLDSEFCSGAASQGSLSTRDVLCLDGYRVISHDNFEGHPFLLCLVPCEPDGREAASA